MLQSLQSGYILLLSNAFYWSQLPFSSALWNRCVRGKCDWKNTEDYRSQWAVKGTATYYWVTLDCFIYLLRAIVFHTVRHCFTVSLLLVLARCFLGGTFITKSDTLFSFGASNHFLPCNKPAAHQLSMPKVCMRQILFFFFLWLKFSACLSLEPLKIIKGTRNTGSLLPKLCCV